MHFPPHFAVAKIALYVHYGSKYSGLWWFFLLDGAMFPYYLIFGDLKSLLSFYLLGGFQEFLGGCEF